MFKELLEEYGENLIDDLREEFGEFDDIIEVRFVLTDKFLLSAKVYKRTVKLDEINLEDD